VVSLRSPQYLPTVPDRSDIEIELSYNLAQMVLVDENVLIAASDICGELDWLASSLYSVVSKVSLTNTLQSSCIGTWRKPISVKQTQNDR
jgi:hypothetical protein